METNSPSGSTDISFGLSGRHLRAMEAAGLLARRPPRLQHISIPEPLDTVTVSRPTLFHWLKRWFLGGVATLALFAVGIVVVNIVDGFPFWRALHRIRQLDTPRLEALAAACTRYEKQGRQQWEGAAIPAEFRALKPVRVSIHPGSSDITLFERDDTIYVLLRIATNPTNQVIGVSYRTERQHTATLWERNPEITRRLQPVDRLVTVWQYQMHSAREWIVRPAELLVIDRGLAVGVADQIVGTFPLAADQRAAIAAAIGGIGPELRGLAFDAGALDGIHLSVSLTPDGRDPETVVLANTWREELQPLLDAITRVAGKEYAIDFPERVRQSEKEFGDASDSVRSVLVTDIRDYYRIKSRIPLPWWRLWPRIDLGA